MRKFKIPSLVAALLTAICFLAYADDLAAIQQKLISEYALTQPTADNSDIVTAGAVLVLKKGNLMMAPISSTNPYQNTYKEGRVTQNALGKGKSIWDKVSKVPGVSGPDAPATRTFVPGEKIWVTGISMKDDGVVFSLFTDAISDVRYKATLKFPFSKGSTPSTGEIEKTVAEVFKVQPTDDTKQQQPAPGGEVQSAVAAKPALAPDAPSTPPAKEAAPPPLAPPPTPPADPKTISAGQTPDQVTAALGPPDKIIRLASKQIYVYKDMKVTFVGGKVTDVQ